jgi:hypothetical protein
MIYDPLLPDSKGSHPPSHNSELPPFMHPTYMIKLQHQLNQYHDRLGSHTSSLVLEVVCSSRTVILTCKSTQRSRSECRKWYVIPKIRFSSFKLWCCVVLQKYRHVTRNCYLHLGEWDNKFLLNVSTLVPEYMGSRSRRQNLHIVTTVGTSNLMSP